MNNLHVVLGAKGGVGLHVANLLNQQGLPFITVQRSKSPVGLPGIEADLLDAQQAAGALEGATHVYLCTGLNYQHKVWQVQWPKLMQHVIAACETSGAKLIFLDNMYMYGPAPLPVPFDETTSQLTFTKKGKVRKTVADLMLKAIEEGRIQGVIGRAADFYGPAAANSLLYFSFLERMLQGKNPQTLLGKNCIHSFAYTPDIAHALVSLALDKNNNGEVFHMPVSGPITIEAITAIFSEKLGKPFKAAYMTPFLLKLLSAFIKPLAEIKEMQYQFRQPYDMSWAKLKNRYPHLEATSYEDGIAAMVDWFLNKKN
ncbi:MAG: NAD-dependent epimerase/dehydratase family protein [Chitinophagaceae bacterium]|jgi:nucleoside-diphosphate-sugar epimerase|nr:NAD-dependent epimerase/dehydratase family protein [Chitinophagaceae bacterium]